MLREPVVERLLFHLPNQQPIVFEDDDPVDHVVDRNDGRDSKFSAWFKANIKYKKAKNLTYSQFPSKFVYHQKEREWRPCKSGYSIGCLYFVAPWAGELHYLRILLYIIKGPKSLNDLKTIGGTVFPTFKYACYALGLIMMTRSL